ncbi:MAG: hypothetical protein OXN81_06255 [Alphaproteobacteria bacterium]|nr:hypothetical protein [Alphaproteobacteria bacterium]
MEEGSRIVRHGFWPLALLWLPAGIAAQAAVRLGPSAGGFAGPGEVLGAAVALAVAAPCGLPLAIACRRLWRLRYRRMALFAGTALGALTVAASVFAGLIGPLAVAACAVLLSLPAWVVWLWLARNG